MVEEEFLPHFLIVEILLWLPVSSLLRFKCVCKSWKTLISDPRFAKDHLRRSTADTTSTERLRLVSYKNYYPRRMVSLPVKGFFDKAKAKAKAIQLTTSGFDQLILGACNGLVCLFNPDRACVTLWNPSTGLMSEKSPAMLKEGVSHLIMYAGFGYDEVNDKYKAMLVAYNDSPVIKVYTFGATNTYNSVTTIENFPCPFTTNFLAKFVSGTLNWTVTRGLHSTSYSLLWFDLEKETYHKMSLPKQQHTCQVGAPPVLGVLSSSLCVSFFDSRQAHWVVWSMKKHGDADSWTKFITISTLNIHEPRFDLLCISENGVLLAKSGNFFLYDPVNGRFEYTPIYGNLGIIQHIYHESLVSPLLC